MIDLLFELDEGDVYSDWIKQADDIDSLYSIIDSEVSFLSGELSKVQHFSVLVTSNGKRIFSRDLIRFGKVL